MQALIMFWNLQVCSLQWKRQQLTLKAAQKKEIPVFVTGNAAYESAKIFDEYDVVRLPLSPIAAYMKLWMLPQ